MDYELYHDESIETGYWHGLLFIPAGYRNEINSLLKSVREDAGYNDRQALNFKRLDGHGDKFKALFSSLQLFICLTRRVIKPDDPGAVRRRAPHYNKEIGLRVEYEEVVRIQKPYGVRFVLLKERDAHRKMSSYPDHASKIETTFRFALKGGCHFMFDECCPITLKKIYFDGHLHYGRVLPQLEVERAFFR